MRVIAEKNENPNIPKAQVSCTGEGYSTRGCGCLLEVTPVDIENHNYTSWGETETAYFVRCPVCGVRTEVFCRSFTDTFWDMVHKR